MKIWLGVTSVMLLAFLMVGIHAQTKSGQSEPTRPAIIEGDVGTVAPMPHHDPLMPDAMKDRMQQMQATREKMMAEMKKTDLALQQQADAMNTATGENKIDAMAVVINSLVQERKTMHENMATMHKEMCDRMQNMGQMQGMDGAKHGNMMRDMSTPDRKD